MLLPLLNDLHGFASQALLDGSERARELCSEVGTPEQLFFILYALAHIYGVRCDKELTPRAIAELYALAERMPTPTHRLLIDTIAMRSAVHEGCFVEACRLAEERLLPHADEAIASLPEFGANPLNAARCHYAWSLWMLGDVEAARATVRAALADAEARGTPFTIAVALWFTALIATLDRHPERAAASAERCATLSAEHGYAFWNAVANAVTAWARVQQGEEREGLEDLRRALAALRATGAILPSTYVLAFIAEAHLRAGSIERGIAVVDEALHLAESTLDRGFRPELWRLKAELLLSRAANGRRRRDPAEHLRQAEECLARAVDLARMGRAKSLELRALTSQARMRQQQGDREQVGLLLDPICSWFTERGNAENADLAAARALLAQASSIPSRPRRRLSPARAKRS